MITVNLKQPIKVNSKGENFEAYAVKMFSPCYKQDEETSYLDWAFTKAEQLNEQKSFDLVKGFIDPDKFDQFIEKAREQSEAKVKTDDGKAKRDVNYVVETLTRGLNAEEMTKCKRYFRSLLTSQKGEKAEVEGEKMTEFVYDKLSFHDVKNLMGNYIVNFIMPSQEDNDN